MCDFVPVLFSEGGQFRMRRPFAPSGQGARQWAMSCLLLKNFAHSLGVSSKQFQHILQ